MQTVIVKAAWALSIAGALAALYIILFQVATDKTAERQADCAAVALAISIAPYCLARALEGLSRRR